MKRAARTGGPFLVSELRSDLLIAVVRPARFRALASAETTLTSGLVLLLLLAVLLTGLALAALLLAALLLAALTAAAHALAAIIRLA